MASVRLGAAMRQIEQLFGEGTFAGLPDAQILERFVRHRDELAFTALVQRHGPMVLAVCRSVLPDPNDADDAFQAAFLLLARKAKSLWVDDSLGGWLHRVASRIALQIKADAARRRDQERRAAEKGGRRTTSGEPEDDTFGVLHQEIDRLPERYRKPIILCYLEHMTYQQAANHLCWTEGTTQGRLARGRSLLRDRLVRRGVSLGAATLGALTLPQDASAVSMSMLLPAVRAARCFGLGEAAGAGTASTAAEVLVKQAMRTMILAKLKVVAAAGLLIGTMTCVATGLSASGSNGVEQRAATAPRIASAPLAFEPTAERAKADSNETIADRAGPVVPREPGKAEAPPRPEVATPPIAEHDPVGGSENKPSATPATPLAREPEAKGAPKPAMSPGNGNWETPGHAVRRLVDQLKQHPVTPSTGTWRLGLYMLDVENGEVTLIADQPDPGLIRCGSPEWSHDGKRIIFDVIPGNQVPLTRLKVIELAHGRLEINDLGLGNCPGFSPNDDRIVFLNNSHAGGAQSGVWLMQADGSERRLLGDYGRPKWSPNSRQFLIVDFHLPRQATLMDVTPEKSGPIRLPGRNLFPEPSWVGGELIVAAIGGEAPDSIALIDVSEPSAARIKEVLWKKQDGLNVNPFHPLYSAATRRCIFVGKDAQGMAFYAFQQGQSDPPRRLESGGYDELIQDVTISPDGRYVVFASDRPGPRPGKLAPAPVNAATPKRAAKDDLRKAP
jgi:RNA polymerase sigma factor (sigma-70 family)